MKDNILWVFIHPIRSGGDTLIEFIKKHVRKDEIYFPSNVRYDHKGFLPFDKNKTRFAFGHATYYGIHKLTPNREVRYFTFLRDPAERMVSYYNAKMEETDKIIPFEIWYKKQMKNDLVHFLDLKYRGSESSRTPIPKMFMPIIKRLNYKTFFFIQTIAIKLQNLFRKDDREKFENAKKLIDLCWFVGIVEKSDEDFRFLLKSMGFKNPRWVNSGAAKKIIKIDDNLRKMIYKDNALDVKLYQYSLKLNSQRKK